MREPRWSRPVCWITGKFCDRQNDDDYAFLQCGSMLGAKSYGHRGEILPCRTATADLLAVGAELKKLTWLWPIQVVGDPESTSKAHLVSKSRVVLATVDQGTTTRRKIKNRKK